MIPAIVEGGSTPGLLNYLVGPGRANEHETPHLVAGSAVIMRRWGEWETLSPAQGYEIAGYIDQYMTEFGLKPMGSVRTFNRATGKRETVKDMPNHVWHCSLSLSPEEGPLSEEKWNAIATDFMTEMGFNGDEAHAPCRWAAVHHGTSKAGGDHIHIVANVVREDGTKWSPWQDQKHAQRTANHLEHKYGLMVLESRERNRGARADSHADLRASEARMKREAARERRFEAATDRARLENRVRAAAVSARDEVDFVYRLGELGVRARPRFAEGNSDVVVGYSVALHSYDETKRTQWYGGGRLARDLALPRLRARWTDSPETASRAAYAWRQVWAGKALDVRKPRQPRPEWTPRDDMAVRVEALRSVHDAMRSVDPRDPVALADASRDVAGLLAAAGLAREDAHERDVLLRAARSAGRLAQTHTRPAPPSPVADNVVLAAQALSLATSDRQTDSLMLAMELMAMVQSLAALHEQDEQTNTAAALLRDAQETFELVNAEPLPPTAAEAAQARFEALAAEPAPEATDTLPEPEPVPERRVSEVDLEAAGLTEERASRLSRVMSFAMPSAPSAPARRPQEEPAPQRKPDAGHSPRKTL